MPTNVVKAIQLSGLSIYDPLDDRSDLFIDHKLLENLLARGLAGVDLNFPLRTRSKVLKAKICEVLGYPIPRSFKRTQPRFPGQNFDTFVQASNNLQIWNEEISDSRRYVIIRVDDKGTVTGVRVTTGKALAILDTTGTLTHKFQARSRSPVVESRLVSSSDTANVVDKLIATRRDSCLLAQRTRNCCRLSAKNYLIRASAKSVTAVGRCTRPFAANLACATRPTKDNSPT
jgi:hypothetical protein